MTNVIKQILANMYEIEVDNVYAVVPDSVLDEIEEVHNLCKKAGGQLTSRQVIADIIVRKDKNKLYK